jgi:hypothetical protein
VNAQDFSCNLLHSRWSNLYNRIVNMACKTLLCLAPLVLLSSFLAFGQEPLDGPKRPMRDPLLEQMAGSWKLTGRIAGQSAEHSIDANWVLNHQFLRVHEKANTPARDGTLYEALIFVGYDNTSDRYVVHWIDIYGGRFSETLGYGKREGNAIRLTFEYPDGPFHTSFIWDNESKAWRWEMDGKSANGQWKEFGRMTLTRAVTAPTQ